MSDRKHVLISNAAFTRLTGVKRVCSRDCQDAIKKARQEAVAAALARLKAEAFGYPRCVTVEAIDVLLREVRDSGVNEAGGS